MKTILMTVMFIVSSNICFAADQWVASPLVQTITVPQTILIQPQPVVVKPLVKTIEWILVPNVNNVVTSEIRRGLLGREYVVNKNELVTTWSWVPVEVYR